jgi:hypothetical protein
MRKISSAADLKASIQELEIITKRQEDALKLNAKSTAKDFKPVNLIRMGVNQVAEASSKQDIRSTAINTFIGLAAGVITRKIIVGGSRNIFKRTLGAALQAAIIRLFYRKLPEWQRMLVSMLPATKHKRTSMRVNQPTTIRILN